MSPTYTKIITKDGSLTYEHSFDTSRKETMHSMEGAWEETQYIYGEPLNLLIEKKLPLNILSMGLGLGYVEMMILARLLAKNISLENINILSFEKFEVLRSDFTNWLSNKSSNSIYDEILEIICTTENANFEKAKTLLDELVKNKNIRLEEELTLNIKTENKFNLILYDAFSSHSQPELWEEEFLNLFIEKYCAKECIFSTYAAKGSLKRALQNNSFDILKKSGFSTKRESTLAVRNL